MKSNIAVNDIPDFLRKDVVSVEENVSECFDGGQKEKTKSSFINDSKVSPIERDALVQSIQGMDREHLDIILDHIPIELVFNRLGRELDRNKAFIKSMKGAMSMVINE